MSLLMMSSVFPIFLFMFAFSYHSASVSHCLWHNNTCVDACPEWMVEQKCDCSQSYWPALRTCDNPETVLVGTVCGYSRCACAEPTVLDTDTGYCYDVDNCPTNHNRIDRFE